MLEQLALQSEIQPAFLNTTACIASNLEQKNHLTTVLVYFLQENEQGCGRIPFKTTNIIRRGATNQLSCVMLVISVDFQGRKILIKTPPQSTRISPRYSSFAGVSVSS